MSIGAHRGTELTAAPGYRIEVLEHGPDAELGERLVAFWTGAGALAEDAARERLAQVLCVAFGPDGAIAGVNSAYEGTAPLIDRPFWIYRRFLLPEAPPELEAAMLKVAYDELARRYAEGGDGPLGVCAVYRDPVAIARDPAAVWDNGFVYAGYTDAGEQLRVAYFIGARI